MILKLNGKQNLKGFLSKGFDRSVVKSMVVAYRKSPEAIGSLHYAHFNTYEILELFMANNVLSPSIIKAITNEKAAIEKFGLKIYMAAHCFPLTGTLPGTTDAAEYKDKVTTMLCNTVIGNGFRDMLDDKHSAALATPKDISGGEGLDQAEICPPYITDEDEDYDIGYEGGTP